MPRKLRLVPPESNVVRTVTLQKITREMIYGKKKVEKRTETGEILGKVTVTVDGKHFLTPGSTSNQYLDESNRYVPEVIRTDVEGSPLEIIGDMFQSPIRLGETITLQEFFGFSFSKSYRLRSNEDLTPLYTKCFDLLHQERFLKFQYAYYPTAYPQDAVVVPSNNFLFVLVGTYSPPVWAKLNINLEEIYGREDVDEEEFDFERFW